MMASFLFFPGLWFESITGPLSSFEAEDFQDLCLSLDPMLQAAIEVGIKPINIKSISKVDWFWILWLDFQRNSKQRYHDFFFSRQLWSVYFPHAACRRKSTKCRQSERKRCIGLHCHYMEGLSICLCVCLFD